MHMTSAEEIQFLKDEYVLLQNQYEAFDQRSLTIKGWISAGSIGAIAVGLSGKTPHGELIWPVTALLALCFWYLEARWKTFQYALRDRICLIEKIFHKHFGSAELAPFQIFRAWFDSRGRQLPATRPTPPVTSTLKAALLDFVMLPYVLFIGVCLIAWIRRWGT
jgi:hypothetical protein